MADTLKLIERLEAVESDPIGCGLANNSYRNPDGPEAAQAIRELVEGLRDLLAHEPDYSDTVWQNARALITKHQIEKSNNG